MNGVKPLNPPGFESKLLGFGVFSFPSHQADAVLELGHGARRNVRFLRGDEKTRFDFGEAGFVNGEFLVSWDLLTG